MDRKIASIALMLFFIAAAASPAAAWDDVGHKITGYIAWQRMTPIARQNVIRILRTAPEDSHLSAFYMAYGPQSEAVRQLNYFIIVPTWADIVRDRDLPVRFKKYHHGNWHYDDFFWRQVAGRVEMVKDPEEGGQAIRRLAEFDAMIRDPKIRDADKAIAIAWIAHLTGDINQPLHTSGRVTDLEPKGDQGGNLFLLTPPGTPREQQVNLHWYWDSIVPRNKPNSDDACDLDYIAKLSRKLMGRYSAASMQSELRPGQFEEWKKATFAYNNTDVFTNDLERNRMPSTKYQKNAFKVAERQLTLAGYRLGDTLNAVFGAAPAMPQ